MRIHFESDRRRALCLFGISVFFSSYFAQFTNNPHYNKNNSTYLLCTCSLIRKCFVFDWYLSYNAYETGALGSQTEVTFFFAAQFAFYRVNTCLSGGSVHNFVGDATIRYAAYLLWLLSRFCGVLAHFAPSIFDLLILNLIMTTDTHR